MARKVPNLPPSKLHDFIVSDFEGAWDAVAATLPPGRGNFMFARQAMLLLEWAARYCGGKAAPLDALSRSLLTIEPRYFTALPGLCADNREFVLPYDPRRGPREAQLLWALFDLIRNGGAHQYQQILVRLPGGRLFGIQLCGVQHRLTASRRSPKHLGYVRNRYGHTVIHVCPNVLFLDIKQAIHASGLLNRKRLRFAYLQRPHTTSVKGKTINRGPFYAFGSSALKRALDQGHHPRLP
jgi:hypothetical protein